MNLDKILTQIKGNLDSSKKPSKMKVVYLFAHNTSGKTRLSNRFKEKYGDNVLCYNVFLEDLFTWDNEHFIFKMDRNSWLSNLIKNEGLDSQIIGNFKKLTFSKLEPSFDLEEGEIVFKNYTGNEEPAENIKISKGEESFFIWSIFYTVLSLMCDTLSEKEEDRSTKFFNKIKYIVIDDPVSSMDDTRIITITLELIELMKKMSSLQNKVKFLITTHHCLFYNILYNENIPELLSTKYIMSKVDTHNLLLEEQKHDSPFSYHNLIFKEIKKAISSDNIQKYHFNLFRALLEKTANFLGYTKKWSDLLEEDGNKQIFVKQLNHYSHSSLSEIEIKQLQNEDIAAFKKVFNSFVEKFHWNKENEE